MLAGLAHWFNITNEVRKAIKVGTASVHKCIK